MKNITILLMLIGTLYAGAEIARQISNIKVNSFYSCNAAVFDKTSLTTPY